MSVVVRSNSSAEAPPLPRPACLKCLSEIPGPPNGPLIEHLWFLIVSVWGTIEGSCGV